MKHINTVINASNASAHQHIKPIEQTNMSNKHINTDISTSNTSTTSTQSSHNQFIDTFNDFSKKPRMNSGLTEVF
jgi:hypothetical protein